MLSIYFFPLSFLAGHAFLNEHFGVLVQKHKSELTKDNLAGQNVKKTAKEIKNMHKFLMSESILLLLKRSHKLTRSFVEVGPFLMIFGVLYSFELSNRLLMNGCMVESE